MCLSLIFGVFCKVYNTRKKNQTTYFKSIKQHNKINDYERESVSRGLSKLDPTVRPTN